MKYNKFEKHSKKYIAVIIVIALFVITYGVEKFLYYRFPAKNKQDGIRVIRQATQVRHIRLSEFRPGTIRYFTPGNLDMKKSDSLIKKEYRFEIDEHGYIYPSTVYKKPDISVIFFGGSTTECGYVEEENRFPYLVGKLLEKEGNKVNSINSGISGNTSMHSIDIFLNKGLKLNPDVVVMMHNINDLNVLLYENDYWNDNPSRSLLITESLSKDKKVSYYITGLIRSIIPKLYTKLLIMKRRYFDGTGDKRVDEFAHVRGKKLTINKQKILAMFEANLQIFIDIARAKGIIPVLMTQASRLKEAPDRLVIENVLELRGFGIAYEEYRDMFLAMNESIRKIANFNEVLVIDLAKEVPQTSAYMYDVVHFNDEGSKFIAKSIAKQLNRVLHASSGNLN